MSVFICTARHLSAIAWAATKDPTEAGHIFTKLAEENATSYNSRYPSHSPATVLGTHLLFPTKDVPCLRIVAILKQIDCYEYQTCESPTWETSEARKICEQLRAKLIRGMPGYENAPWGL